VVASSVENRVSPFSKDTLVLVLTKLLSGTPKKHVKFADVRLEPARVGSNIGLVVGDHSERSQAALCLEQSGGVTMAAIGSTKYIE
jgi:hypothetical protein